jgi:hypothetical protein
MEQVLPAQVASFLNRFAFHGGTVRRFEVRNRAADQSAGLLTLTVRDNTSGARVRLRIILDGVEEFRFQRRPGTRFVRLKEVRLAYFNGLFYLNLDAFPDNEPPALIDFRASDAFIAGGSLAFEIVPAKPST